MFGAIRVHAKRRCKAGPPTSAEVRAVVPIRRRGVEPLAEPRYGGGQTRLRQRVMLGSDQLRARTVSSIEDRLGRFAPRKAKGDRYGLRLNCEDDRALRHSNVRTRPKAAKGIGASAGSGAGMSVAIGAPTLGRQNGFPKSTMNAAVVEAFGRPLVLREMDIPTPAAGEILIKTEACGVCHTDLHAANGDWPLKPTLPFIPGHEAIGRVVAVGAAVTNVQKGDRVGVPWLYSACGHCEYCLTGWETVCPEAQFGGYTRNGGFAEYLLADPNYVAHIPANLAARDAAAIICAGVTTYKGIKETEAQPGEWIAISGAGGLGHLGIQYAKAMGLHVCAIDIDDGKLAHASRIGADLVINARGGDPAAALKAKIGGGAHGVLITAPSLAAFKQGVGMTRKRGTCVLVGLPPGEFPVDLFNVVANCITIRGSFVGSRQDMVEALAFAAEGHVKADIEMQPLSSINEVLIRLANGDVPSRVILEFPDE